MSEGYTLATRFFSIVIICFGVTIIAVTLSKGGGVLSFGLLIGVVFLALGCGRLYLALRSSE